MEKDNIFQLVMNALSDPQRIKILKMLHERIMSVSEIQAELMMAKQPAERILRQPSISKHLTALKRAGLVHAFKDGLKVYYYVADCEYTPLTFLDILRKMKQEKVLDQPDFKLGFENYLNGKGHVPPHVPPRVFARTRRLEKELQYNSFEFRLWMDYFLKENEGIRYISRFLKDLHPYFDPNYIDRNRKRAKRLDLRKKTFRRRSKLREAQQDIAKDEGGREPSTGGGIGGINY